MSDIRRVHVAEIAGEWYRKTADIAGMIEAETAERADGDGWWRVVLRPRDGSPAITVAVSATDEVKKLFDYATPIKKQSR